MGFVFDEEVMFLAEDKQNFPLLVQVAEIVDEEITQCIFIYL